MVYDRITDQHSQPIRFKPVTPCGLVKVTNQHPRSLLRRQLKPSSGPSCLGARHRHPNFSSFFRSFELLFNMPRGRPKWKANDTRDQPAIRRRLTESHSSTPAQLSTNAEVEEVSQASDEAAQVTHEAARAQTRGTSTYKCRWVAPVIATNFSFIGSLHVL